MDRFEATLIYVIKLDQYMTYPTFNMGLLHDLAACDHSTLSNLVIGRIEKY